MEGPLRAGAEALLVVEEERRAAALALRTRGPEAGSATRVAGLAVEGLGVREVPLRALLDAGALQLPVAAIADQTPVFRLRRGALLAARRTGRADSLLVVREIPSRADAHAVPAEQKPRERALHAVIACGPVATPGVLSDSRRGGYYLKCNKKQKKNRIRFF